MKLRIALILVFVMLCGIFCGCQPQDQYPYVEMEQWSVEKGHDIKDAIWEYYYKLDQQSKAEVMCYEPWFTEGYDFGLKYLGYENGYDFFTMDDGVNISADQRDDKEYCSIGGVRFEQCNSRTLWAHKDGQLYLMAELYDQQEISIFAVSAAKEVYDLYIEWQLTHFGADDSVRCIEDTKQNGWEYPGGYIYDKE